MGLVPPGLRTRPGETGDQMCAMLLALQTDQGKALTC